MKRYVDTLFRYWFIALVPIVVLPLAAFAISRAAPPTVSAKADIWVDSVSLKQLSYVDPNIPPAQNMANYLNQLLQSPSFDIAAARRSAVYWRSIVAQPNRNNLAVADLSSNTAVYAVGANLLVVSYSSENGRMGIQLVQGILDQASHEIVLLNQQQAARDIAYYSGRLIAAQSRFDRSAKKLGRYLSAHGIVSANIALRALSDPTLAATYQAVQAAATDVTNAQQQLSTAQTQQAERTSFRVVDAPAATAVTVSKRKQLTNLIIPLALALLLSGTFVVVKTSLDRSVRFADEVPVLLGLPVLAIVPYSSALAADGKGASSSSGSARSHFRLPKRKGPEPEQIR